MIRAVFGSHNDNANNWNLKLTSPSDVLVARARADVVNLIKTAEQASLRGCYVAMLLAYEAAPAFDMALQSHDSNSSLPLAWAAIFPTVTTSTEVPPGNYRTSDWKPAISREDYQRAVESILGSIADGYTYQVNYSFPLTATFNGDPFSFYVDLTRAQGAQYSAFLDLGDFQILSLSPELFFERTGDRVRTKPMKGTIGRGRWTAEDLELAEYLRQSKKDQAENVMIVDLLRNDLGKVSKTGSVTVSSLFELERFETLWQMTSTVESTLNDGVGLVELLSALFPCGSITGAPKISTMKIINRLEPFPRGVYTGAIGLLRPGGDCIFNVAIRTLQLDSKSGVLTFGVGGGVTTDSTAEREYRECLVKSAFLEKRALSFQLLETMLLEDGEFFLLDRHLARLTDSANFFGFEFSTEELTATLQRLAIEHHKGCWKVRLLLSRNGNFELEVLPANIDSRVRRVTIAAERVHSSNALLFHKTTDRSAFSSSLELSREYDEVVFFNERGEVTESTNANVVVSIDDQMWTPPIDSGLLAGTFREQLLSEGVLKERVITVEELVKARECFLINSVQKWMRAVMSAAGPPISTDYTD
jgi:para-aminobenzoate synthetase/4-amino-4-deoxychorismate lyase